MTSRNVRTPQGIARRGFLCQFGVLLQEAVEGKGGVGVELGCGFEAPARRRGARGARGRAWIGAGEVGRGRRFVSVGWRKCTGET